MTPRQLRRRATAPLIGFRNEAEHDWRHETRDATIFGGEKGGQNQITGESCYARSLNVFIGCYFCLPGCRASMAAAIIVGISASG